MSTAGRNMLHHYRWAWPWHHEGRTVFAHWHHMKLKRLAPEQAIHWHSQPSPPFLSSTPLLLCSPFKQLAGVTLSYIRVELGHAILSKMPHSGRFSVFLLLLFSHFPLVYQRHSKFLSWVTFLSHIFKALNIKKVGFPWKVIMIKHHCILATK